MTQKMKLTPEQKIFLLSKNLKDGDFCILHVGTQVSFYTAPDYDSLFLTKGFSQEVKGMIKIKEEVGAFFRVNFVSDRFKACPDFYIKQSDLKIRGIIESLLLTLICVPYFWAKNYFTNPVSEKV